MPEINLLKNELKEHRTINLGNISGSKSLYVMLGLIGLVLLSYLLLAIFDQNVKRKITEIEREGTATEAEIQKLESERQKAISVQVRLNSLAGLLKYHAEWTPVLAELEKFTYIPVAYQTLEVDEAKHEFSVTGVAPTYTDIAKLMVGLARSDYFGNVELQASGQAEGGEGGFSFGMKIDFDPALINKPN